MVQQALLNDARTSGESIARQIVDAFEEGNKSPTPKELAALEKKARANFAKRSAPWTDPVVVQTWRDGMEIHLAARLKQLSRRHSTASVGLR